jgi:hypothetical protein
MPVNVPRAPPTTPLITAPPTAPAALTVACADRVITRAAPSNGFIGHSLRLARLQDSSEERKIPAIEDCKLVNSS